MRDVWLVDDEPGCLECGALRFVASQIDGVCVDCADEAFGLHPDDARMPHPGDLSYERFEAVDVGDEWMDWVES